MESSAAAFDAMVSTEKRAQALVAHEAGAYLPQLDGLRGLAILAVVFHHFGFHPASWMLPANVNVPFCRSLTINNVIK
ncbi:MAG: hypothetical protein WAM53_07795 [Terrimicrobiaceae bacterium]